MAINFIKCAERRPGLTAGDIISNIKQYTDLKTRSTAKEKLINHENLLQDLSNYYKQCEGNQSVQELFNKAKADSTDHTRIATFLMTALHELNIPLSYNVIDPTLPQTESPKPKSTCSKFGCTEKCDCKK